MKIEMKNFDKNILSFFRSLGYIFIDRAANEEWNFVKKISSADYPRFHCYAQKNKEGLNINLHLDQKKPSYEGTSRHGGEYDGTVVEKEAARIKQAP